MLCERHSGELLFANFAFFQSGVVSVTNIEIPLCDTEIDCLLWVNRRVLIRWCKLKWRSAGSRHLHKIKIMVDLSIRSLCFAYTGELPAY